MSVPEGMIVESHIQLMMNYPCAVFKGVGADKFPVFPDGSVLSTITKIAFLFGVFQMPFTGLGTYAMAIAVAVMSAFVLSGAPGGGLVGEMLIVSLFGFPGEAFPLIATIGFLVDPMATSLNASGDAVASMMIARIVEGKNWMQDNLAEMKKS